MKKCPFCKGTGSLKRPYHQDIDWGKIMKFLKKEGYSYSQMCEITGFKSKRSIMLYIESSLNLNKQKTMPKVPFLNEYTFKYTFKNHIFIIKKFKTVHVGVAWYMAACKIAKGNSRLLKVELIKTTII